MGNKDQLSEKIKGILDKSIKECEGDLDFLNYILPEVVQKIVLAVKEDKRTKGCQ